MTSAPAPTPGSDPLLKTLVEAALAGGREVLAVYATEFDVELKGDKSPVSEADRRAEAVIEPLLRAAFPDIPVVAEEAVSEGRVPAIGRRFFLVDPLDGTKEFIKRNGEFTVNIGLIEGGRPVAGVVLAPALGRIYAGAGDSAWTAKVDAGSTRVEDAEPLRAREVDGAPVAVASRSHSTPETEAALDKVGAAERRSIGSSLKFCLVAESAADFYPRFGPTMEWDTAAGDAVLRAAGGAVVTLDGRPLGYGKLKVAGMRDFENPFFIATGDAALLDRLELSPAE
ncbi:3'(2'),5'-bisphosphate nucleotidase CysQ [Propylenella binzhouense]|uniref:3'(2'),5'-bisphosphate nucleotidase CysQ n=1 Tax=Propylenella binzhouense TaxID=2555902 RepID=A0A964T8M1_9HYPH|nr:3'(2'),5'-bisphosphate nucleotidase CysQ [Propylenella binzhouense]MYZ49877.1 3'(2'),5'-bisphosphate nucleotidase CysQ [Propylenella binzhouense]